MDLKIRKEEENDYPFIFDLIEKAFHEEAMSDHQEQYLVDRLRQSDSFREELSIVAEKEGKIVGYVLLSEINIINSQNQSFISLALAPIAVLPAYQGQGIAGALMNAAHEKAKELGYGSIVILGHADYYPRFGYRLAKEFGIRLPFDVPDENCFVIELSEGTLKHINGTVVYPAEFG
ncbi:N-acetyltransferase [Sphingobacterium sp.]|uniref:GNAT family N-acetyltransferase n=1 Tax=Sphingobacterium sp. TaxID=341027 RepID=UPI0028A74AC0|nr:N-acetyltransferase [Sphingobacterium sp.]